MGPRVGLDGRKISFPPGFDPDRPARSSVAIPTELHGLRPEVNRPLKTCGCRWIDDNIEVDLQEIDGGSMDWIDLAQSRDT